MHFEVNSFTRLILKTYSFSVLRNIYYKNRHTKLTCQFPPREKSLDGNLKNKAREIVHKMAEHIQMSQGYSTEWRDAHEELSRTLHKIWDSKYLFSFHPKFLEKLIRLLTAINEAGRILSKEKWTSSRQKCDSNSEKWSLQSECTRDSSNWSCILLQVSPAYL